MQQGDRLDGVQQAALLRERGQIVEAVTLLDQVMTTCEKNGDWIHFADALAERIVCWKHLLQNRPRSQESKYLSLMKRDAEAGLRLRVSISYKSPFYLRLGDYYIFLRDFVLAERAYRKAVDLKEGEFDEGEYIAHWAESLLAVEQTQYALKVIRKSLNLAMKRKGGYERWHWLIVLSGILSRKVKIDLVNGHKRSAQKAFAKGYALAWVLLVWYWKPQRWRQYHQAIRDELLKRMRRR